MLKVFLPCAGYGERLQPITLYMPKHLLPIIRNTPIISFWINTLINNGIKEEDIIVSTYHLKHILEGYLEKNYPKVKIYSESKLEKTGMALGNIKSFLGDRFLIINPDTFINTDSIKECLKIHVNRLDKFPVILGVKFYSDVSNKGLVVIEKDTITKYIEKPSGKRAGFANGGMILMSKIVFESFTDDELDNMDISDMLPKFSGIMGFFELNSAEDIGQSVWDYNRIYMLLNRR